jgi:predicted 3-demethylubiquinone-9 3-methyltransferase (glyoxalase superfamily)
MSVRVEPFLWFDSEAEEAAAFYTSLIPNSRVVEVTRYGEGGPGEPGHAMVVRFELDGRPLSAPEALPRLMADPGRAGGSQSS